MEFSALEIAGTVIAGLVTWLGFIEKRLRSMMIEFEHRLNERDAKLDAKHKVSEIVQQTLKEDIAEIKVKIDMLIALQLEQNKKQ